MKEDKTLSVLCFDLQSCPQSSISVFYYKKKLAIYNLTVCEVKDMEGYCLLWHEGIAGRRGNVIASALVTALEKIAQDRPNVKHIILWSDSCVAQNKNSHMSSALLNFLKENPQITTIKQKFQEPGHSCVQQVDSIHSVLDKRLKGQELHSFLSVTRAIIKAKQRKPYKITQLQRKNFKNFKKLAQAATVNAIPYAKVKELVYTNTCGTIKHKNNHTKDLLFTETEIFKQIKSSKNAKKGTLQKLPIPQEDEVPPRITEDKKKHIKFTYKFLSTEDKAFWNATFK
jgi:hypothetical protein